MQRAQIFCLGASSMYGVGGSKGGWPDLLKFDIHKTQYSEGGAGQIHEIYNLSIPGAQIKDCYERSGIELTVMRKKGRKVISIVQLITNNSIAIDDQDNFISTPDEYEAEITKFLEMVKSYSDELICLGATPTDQAKTMPIVKDAEKNRFVYMSNERKKLFESKLKDVTDQLGVSFIPLYDKASKLNWEEELLYIDGIHPNDAGYKWIYEQIKPTINSMLAS